jgi:hypothetical protein
MGGHTSRYLATLRHIWPHFRRLRDAWKAPDSSYPTMLARQRRRRAQEGRSHEGGLNMRVGIEGVALASFTLFWSTAQPAAVRQFDDERRSGRSVAAESAWWESLRSVGSGTESTIPLA